ncbi:hypothetical protein HEB94_002572 [Actinopolymorpha pittospori]|uniref:Uncharacterized protein n=1 Tax=Actinopolymorpha pittospori TaxID=648752 RepID=A0A927MS95_9ACTN|nr:hypothetical protein [Actinopolymorpha pittospori]
MIADSYLARESARIAYQFEGRGAPVRFAHGVSLGRAAVRRIHLADSSGQSERATS